MQSEYDLISVGRISVDLFAQELNTPFSEPQTFAKSIGGSPTNVAIAAARLGLKSAIVTKVGSDLLGAYAIKKLQSFGVETEFVSIAPNGLTPVVLASQDPPDDPKIIFHRQTNAPDTQLTLNDLSDEHLIAAKNFWVSACALSQGETATTIQKWLEIRNSKSETIIDLDYRPSFWPSVDAARTASLAALNFCTIAIGNMTECEIALGVCDPESAAREFLSRGVRLAIVKMGGKGVLLATADEQITIPPLPIKLICGLGSGDAFGGALLRGLTNGWNLKEIGDYANSAGAFLAAQLMCSDAMPTQEQLQNFISEFERKEI